MPFLVQVHVAPTREEARRRTEESVRWYFSTLLRLIPRGYEQYEYFTALAEQFTGEVDYDMIVNNSISWIGTPDDIAEKIRVVRDELGIRRFVAWFQFGGLDHRYVMDSMKLFAREVMPEFRSPQVPQAPVTAESRA
jgi:alkanesulfonate monooxygenase SsuD/methylene tetrahydromethanopterin reductase-like flavin-dependent oxidoreductase (luciferase family)